MKLFRKQNDWIDLLVAVLLGATIAWAAVQSGCLAYAC